MSDKWKRSRMAADYDEELASSLESYGDYGLVVVPTTATALIVDGVEIGASYGEDDLDDLVPDRYYEQFASATPQRLEPYDISSQRAPLTARQRYKEETGLPDAESMFEAHRHKRPAGSHGSKNGTGKAKPMPAGGGDAGWGPKPASKKVGSRGPDTICIGRLTPGEYAVFETAMNNRGEDLAASVLDVHYFACEAQLRFPADEPTFERRTLKRVSNFYVAVRDIEFWRKFPKAALACLVDYAHTHFADRIARIDVPEPMESIAA